MKYLYWYLFKRFVYAYRAKHSSPNGRARLVYAHYSRVFNTKPLNLNLKGY